MDDETSHDERDRDDGTPERATGIVLFSMRDAHGSDLMFPQGRQPVRF